MAQTYEKIATTTAGGSSGTITFASIPATYTDLFIVINGTVGVSDCTMLMQYNGDTTTNYSSTVLSGNGSAGQSFNATGATEMYCGRITTSQSTTIIQILNYANATTYKTFISRGNSATRTSAFVGTWRSTAAITTVTLTFNSAGSFAAGTTASVYGIKAA